MDEKEEEYINTRCYLEDSIADFVEAATNYGLSKDEIQADLESSIAKATGS